jgi:hypothetical protein
LLKSTAIPSLPEFAKLGSREFRNMISYPVMQAEVERELAQASQRDVVARQVDLPEPINFFEFGQAVLPAFTV